MRSAAHDLETSFCEALCTEHSDYGRRRHQSLFKLLLEIDMRLTDRLRLAPVLIALGTN
jgi:hypothetical protein